MTRLAFAFAIICVATAIATFCSIRRGEVVAVPLFMTVGDTRRVEFRVSESARYSIEIRCRRKLPFDQLVHELGKDGLVSIELAADGSAVAVEPYPARVTVAPKTRSEEMNRLAFTKTSISALIATFHGETRKRYVLVLTVLRAADVLSMTQPTLVVENVSDIEAKALVNGCGALFSLVCAVTAVVIFWRAIRRKTVASRPK